MHDTQVAREIKQIPAASKWHDLVDRWLLLATRQVNESIDGTEHLPLDAQKQRRSEAFLRAAEAIDAANWCGAVAKLVDGRQRRLLPPLRPAPVVGEEVEVFEFGSWCVGRVRHLVQVFSPTAVVMFVELYGLHGYTARLLVTSRLWRRMGGAR